jgi:hypothetical protein
MSASDDEYDAIFGDIDLAALDAVRVPMSVPAPARAPPPAAQSIARQSVGNAVAGPSTGTHLFVNLVGTSHRCAFLQHVRN